MGETCVEGSRSVSRGTLLDVSFDEPGHDGSSRRGLTAGVRIGRYALLRKVGSGGMGVVYAAYDPQLDRRVALKVLKGDGFDPARASRGHTQLVREAQAMARLSHPNVVTVHDVGTVSRPSMVFVAMEFIEGIALRRWWEEQPRSWQEVVDVFVQAGEGLAAAHDAGLIHRDFKPDNVLVGDDGRVVVTDFGLARRMDPGGPHEDVDSDLTLAAAASVVPENGTLGQAGTPAYMPPETHHGAQPSAAGDQFSFGVTLYEALFGEHPFVGTDPVSLATAVMDDRRRDVREDRRVPKRVRRAIARALYHDPAQRWPSMHPFLAELSATRRSKGPMWLATGAGLAAVSVALVTTSDERPCANARDHFAGIWDDAAIQRTEQAFAATQSPFAAASWRATRDELDAYVDRWVDTRTDACEATARGEQSQELLDLRMQCLDLRRESLHQLLDVLQAADVTVVGQATRAVDELPALQTCSDPEFLRRAYPAPTPDQRRQVSDATVRLSRARALFDAGLLHSAREAAQSAVEAAQSSDYPPVRARARLEAGVIAATLGDEDVAEEHLRDALTAARLAGDEALELESWLELTHAVGVTTARADEVEPWYPLVEALLDRSRASDSQRAAFEATRGAIAQNAGRSAEAVAHFQRALEFRARADFVDPLRLARDQARLASALADRGRLEDADLACEEAQRLQHMAYGATHPLIADANRSCARVQRRRGNEARARMLLEHALHAATSTFGYRHRTVAEIRSDLGSIERDAGNYTEAIQLQRRALEILRSTPSRSRLAAANVHIELARSLSAAGRLGAAGAEVARARTHLSELAAPPPPARARLAMVDAEISIELRRFDEAGQRLLEAIDSLDASDPRRALAGARLAEVELERGRPIAARRQIDTSMSALDHTRPPPRIIAAVRFAHARVSYALDGTGRDSALEAIALWAARPDKNADTVAEAVDWLQRTSPGVPVRKTDLTAP